MLLVEHELFRRIARDWNEYVVVIRPSRTNVTAILMLMIRLLVWTRLLLMVYWIVIAMS
jgi:hypothetical protein